MYFCIYFLIFFCQGLHLYVYSNWPHIKMSHKFQSNGLCNYIESEGSFYFVHSWGDEKKGLCNIKVKCYYSLTYSFLELAYWLLQHRHQWKTFDIWPRKSDSRPQRLWLKKTSCNFLQSVSWPILLSGWRFLSSPVNF